MVEQQPNAGLDENEEDLTATPLLSRDLAGVDVACPVCSYNLRGGAGGGCPECGTALTYADVFLPVNNLSLIPAFDTKRPVPSRERVPVGMAAAAAFMLLGVAMIPAFMLAASRGAGPFLGGFVLLAGMGLFWPVFTRSRGRGRWTLVIGGAILVAMFLAIALRIP